MPGSGACFRVTVRNTFLHAEPDHHVSGDLRPKSAPPSMGMGAISDLDAVDVAAQFLCELSPEDRDTLRYGSVGSAPVQELLGRTSHLPQLQKYLQAHFHRCLEPTAVEGDCAGG